MTDTRLFNTNSRSQFCVEISSDDLHVFFLFNDTVDCFIGSFNLVVWVTTAWHVCTDKGDWILVD